VALGILLSRLAGLIRERVFAHFFGASFHADVWRAALRLPNVLQNLLGEGTLSASFIPLYSRFLAGGREEDARRFAGAVLGLLSVTTGGIVLVGWAVAPWVVPLFIPRWEPEKQALTVQVVRILLPMTGVLVLSAWALGVLNTHRRFLLSYAAPVLWNLAMIAAVVGGAAIWALPDTPLLLALAWGALAGGVLQLLVMLPLTLRLLGGLRLSLSALVPGVREGVRNLVPVVAARGVVNLSGYVDLFLAALLVEGAVGILGYSQVLYLLPISLFGMSVAVAELPELSREREGAGGEALPRLRKRVDDGLAQVGFFIVPSTLVYLFFGDLVVAALFQTGAFGAPEVAATHAVLAAYALGLMASARSRLLSSAWFALGDTGTPARIAGVRVLLSTAAGALLMFPLDQVGPGELRLGAAGLALGASLGAWLEFTLLERRLEERLGEAAPRGGHTLRLLAAGAVGVAGGWVASLPLRPLHPLVAAPGTLLVFGVLFLALTRALGVDGPLRRSPSAPTPSPHSGPPDP